MKEEATLITEISSDVRDFFKSHIHSLWQLELIMCMRAHQGMMPVDQIAKLLYSTPAAIESTLERFVQLGVLKEIPGNPNTFIYAPSNELRQTIDAAAGIYSSRRIDVINLIFASPRKAPRLNLE